MLLPVFGSPYPGSESGILAKKNLVGLQVYRWS